VQIILPICVERIGKEWMVAVFGAADLNTSRDLLRPLRPARLLRISSIPVLICAWTRSISPLAARQHVHVIGQTEGRAVRALDVG